MTAIVCVTLQGCAELPSLDDRTISVTLPRTADTPLGRALAPVLQGRGEHSGLVRLVDGRDAFAARMRLADVAERSLDVQYYIWHDDLTGTLLFDALRRAADRGVRVRVLLDDNNTAGLADLLAAMAAHPNIEMRLFNPFVVRRWRPLAYITDFPRLNRRMHNKSFTADNQVTIVGGRNIGDEYFGAGRDVLFFDLDVMAIGPVVNDVSQDFDRYWASDSAYPAERLLPHPGASAMLALAAAAERVKHSPEASAYMAAVAEQPFVREMLERRLTFDWAPTRLVSDDPAKGQGRVPQDELLWTRLTRIMKAPEHELHIISPYFVPEEAGTTHFANLAKQGVKVTILTNSLESTDVPAVHSGYARWRRSLLAAGISLLEIKRSDKADSARSTRLGSSSDSALHGKAYSVDRQQAFIGSFNFDPRSAWLNTELGFVIDSPAMAGAIADAVEGRLAARAYHVRLTDTGTLQWVDQVGGKQVVHDVEPGTTLWQRFGVSLMSLLPLEWLL
jgi:putative cardiolipin synthase